MSETVAQLSPRSLARAEYEAVRGGGAGLFDLSARGRIEVRGAEAVQFLNGLVTNDVKTLAPGTWMYAALPNVQGRLLALARVLRADSADVFLFDTEAATRARLYESLARFTLAGDFRVRDLTDETAQLSLQGAQALRIAADVLGSDAAQVARLHGAAITWRGQQLTVLRATHTSEDGYDFITGADVMAELRSALCAAGALPCGQDALEVLRVEAGVPRFGVDMTETNVVLEAVPDEAVSYTKGCYVGQEIIARIHWRGHVAKKLTGLLFEHDQTIMPEAGITIADGKEIGRVTSAVFSPQLGRTVGLGYVKFDYLAAGTEVRVGDERQVARVAELPLVRGSWWAEHAA
ncbi:MAG TPA: glycine cleavage T C-terminal barrel domain-containing protein [Pyrinomonadaceae bacterium]|jgi:folate-binding protein YgfZ